MAIVIKYSPNRLKFPKQVYPDANFLISFYVPHHPWYQPASTLLVELTKQKIKIQSSLFTIDEALYQLMIINYEDKKGKGKWQEDRPLKNDPNICSRFAPELNKFVKALLEHPYFSLVEFPATASAFLSDWLNNISTHSLAPRDAFHLSFLKAVSIEMIITNDTDFDRVSDNSLKILHFW